MYVIIAGGGQVGMYLSRHLIHAGHDVAVIDIDRGICEELARCSGPLVIYGDCTDVNTLIDAGIDHADCVASVTRDDAINLITCQLAKMRFNVRLTVSRINNPDNESVFKRLGVDFGLNSTKILATVIQEGIIVEGLIPLASLGRGKASLVEIMLSEDSPSANRVIRSLRLPHGSIICAILRGDDVIFPHGNTVLSINDRLISLVAPDSVEEFRKVF